MSRKCQDMAPRVTPAAVRDILQRGAGYAAPPRTSVRPRRAGGRGWPGLLPSYGVAWRYRVKTPLSRGHRYMRGLVCILTLSRSRAASVISPAGFSRSPASSQHCPRASARGATVSKESCMSALENVRRFPLVLRCCCVASAARRLRPADRRRSAAGPRPGGAAAGRGRRRHRRAARSAWSPSCRGGSKVARRAGARARRRHPAKAAVPRRQRREGRPGAVPDRRGAVPGRAAERAGARSRARRPTWRRPRAGRALQAAGRGQRDQQAGIRQRGRGAEAGRGRRGGRPGRA